MLSKKEKGEIKMEKETDGVRKRETLKESMKCLVGGWLDEIFSIPHAYSLFNSMNKYK